MKISTPNSIFLPWIFLPSFLSPWFQSKSLAELGKSGDKSSHSKYRRRASNVWSIGARQLEERKLGTLFGIRVIRVIRGSCPPFSS
jgi:hypothetical protein